MFHAATNQWSWRIWQLLDIGWPVGYRPPYSERVSYDPELADRIRELLGGRTVEEKRMFGGLAFLVNGHMSVSASREGGLLIRCEPDQTEALLREPGASEFSMSKRGPMDGWLRVSAAAVEDDEALSTWVNRSYLYAQSLPAKKGR
jgi:TfoX/Sxy family transcriptional regulator of competence genes